MTASLLKLSVWMHRHRRVFKLATDWITLAALCCFMFYGSATRIIAGQDSPLINGRDVHDMVVTNTIRLQDHRDRIEKLETTVIHQGDNISLINQGMALFHQEITNVEDNQTTNNRLLWAVFLTVLSKLVYDIFFAPRRSDSGRRHRRGGDPPEDAEDGNK